MIHVILWVLAAFAALVIAYLAMLGAMMVWVKWSDDRGVHDVFAGDKARANLRRAMDDA